MNIEFRASFASDIRKIRDARMRERVREAIEAVAGAESLKEVGGLRKPRGSDRCYRIRLGDYRIGLSVKGSTVTFVRFLHRREIYRYYP